MTKFYTCSLQRVLVFNIYILKGDKEVGVSSVDGNTTATVIFVISSASKVIGYIFRLQ